MTRTEQLFDAVLENDALILSVWNEYCCHGDDVNNHMWKEMSTLPGELSDVSTDDVSLFEVVLRRFRLGRDLDSVNECPANTSRRYYRYGKDDNFETTDDPALHIKMSEIHNAIDYFIEHPDRYTIHDKFFNMLWCNASAYGLPIKYAN